MTLGPADRAFLETLAARIAPLSATLGPAERDAAFARIDGALSSRPARMRRQFLLFLRVLRYAPVLRYGAAFDALGPARQDAVLAWFQDAPVALLRKGFWGTKTLLYMGVYGRPEAAAAVHWTPSRAGNERLAG